MALSPKSGHVQLRRIGYRTLKPLLIAILIGLWLYPWSIRLRTPSVVLDDIARIEHIQSVPLATRLVAPFNEHLAPFFETVSTLTWWVTGGKLEFVPLGFTLVSYIPFLGCLRILWLLVRHEFDSPAAAWMAVTLFATTPIYAECIYWYSASSFTWALLFTLASLWFARGASGDGQPSALNLIAAAFCCLFAPMGSAIGVLSGPVATLRGFSLQSPRSLLRTNRRSSVPLLGTVFFLVFACFFKHEDVVSRSIIANGHLIDGVYNVGLAPTYLVLTGYLGISNADASLPRLMIGLGSLLGAIFVIHRIRRESSDRRRWLLIASFLILGGYSLIYCVRVRLVGPETLIGVQRYHLFPCVGLVMLVTTCLADRLRRIDRRPLASVGLAAMVALGLIYLNRPLIRERARFVSLHADQRSVMKVLDRLAVVAHALGVSRAQVLQAFDPIEPRWCYPGGNILKMLPETSAKPRIVKNPQETRTLLLSWIPPEKQAVLFSSTNLTSRVFPADVDPRSVSRHPAALVGCLRLKPTDQPGHYWCLGWPDFLEFSLPTDSNPPAAVGLNGLSRSETWELWWASDGSGWSRDRIIVLQPSRRQETTSDWVLPLEQIPGLDPSRLRRLRLGVRDRGPITLNDVVLIR